MCLCVVCYTVVTRFEERNGRMRHGEWLVFGADSCQAGVCGSRGVVCVGVGVGLVLAGVLCGGVLVCLGLVLLLLFGLVGWLVFLFVVVVCGVVGV